jgi:hypothetical protein
MEWNGMKNNIFISNELVFSFVFSIPSSTRSIFNLVGVIKHLKRERPNLQLNPNAFGDKNIWQNNIIPYIFECIHAS